MKISITRALGELKLLEARIQKKIQETGFVGIYQEKDKQVVGTDCKTQDFIARSNADLQCILDLINRRHEIKSKIFQSNATSKVLIGDIEYTVIEAIERKSSILFDEQLTAAIKTQYVNAIASKERQKPQLDQAVADMVNQNLGTDRKKDSNEYNTIAQPFLDANTYKLVGIDNPKHVLDARELSSEEFKLNVDIALSESNSSTFIEIS